MTAHAHIRSVTRMRNRRSVRLLLGYIIQDRAKSSSLHEPTPHSVYACSLTMSKGKKASKTTPEAVGWDEGLISAAVQEVSSYVASGFCTGRFVGRLS